MCLYNILDFHDMARTFEANSDCQFSTMDTLLATNPPWQQQKHPWISHFECRRRNCNASQIDRPLIYFQLRIKYRWTLTICDEEMVEIPVLHLKMNDCCVKEKCDPILFSRKEPIEY